MISLKLIRNSFAAVEEKLLLRNVDKTTINLLKQAVTDYHQLKQQTELIQAERNRISKQISLAYIKNKQDDVQKLTLQMQKIKSQLNHFSQRVHAAEQTLEKVLFQIPNLPADSVPVGSSEVDNKVLFQSGTIPSFSFTPLNHWELADQLGLINFELGPKLTGTKFVVYRGLGAELYRALINFSLDHQIYNNGYTNYIAPVILNEKSLTSTGQLPKFVDDLYKIEDKYLSPTGEVQLVNLYRDQILIYDQLPLKLATNSLCFRRESGAAGKDTRGTIRLHQFQKTEIVIICAPEDSWKQLEIICDNAESVLKKLKLPYQKVALCTADLSFASAKTYDLEVWLPGSNDYREISSCSNTLDFQSLRSQIRYRNPKTKRIEYVHCLNASGVAIDRLFAAVLENYQLPDGSIMVPEVLVPYMKGLTSIKMVN